MYCYTVVAVIAALSTQTFTATVKRSRADEQCEEGYAKCPFLSTCIRQAYFCDGDNDCTDKSDEDPAFCADRTCPPDHLRCDSGQCIDKTEFCRRHILCRDGSLTLERVNCSGVKCQEGYSKCPFINKCIKTSYTCDGDDDCGDSSDEDPAFCADRTCPENHIRCDSGQCIDKTEFCNGEIQCRDKSFKSELLSCPDIKCEEGYAKCPFLSKCIRHMYFCDVDNDCTDNSDEDPAMCADRTCPSDHLRCDSGQCIDKTGLCFEDMRCKDGSLTPERVDCSDAKCHEGYTKCPFINKCIRSSYFCDGDNDCTDNSDEDPAFCGTSRPKDQPSDIIPPMTNPWMMCLIRMQMSCVPPTLNSPEGLHTFFQQFLTHHLSVTCGPLLEMKKCAMETLKSCDETALQSMLPMYKKYIDAMVDVVDYVCDQHINVFEQHKACLFQVFGTDEDGNNLGAAMETSCQQEAEQFTPERLEEMCSSGSQPDLTCIFGVIQNKCGSPIVDRLKELVTKIFRGCSADISRSNRRLSVFQRYLHLYRTHY